MQEELKIKSKLNDEMIVNHTSFECMNTPCFSMVNLGDALLSAYGGISVFSFCFLDYLWRHKDYSSYVVVVYETLTGLQLHA